MSFKKRLLMVVSYPVPFSSHDSSYIRDSNFFLQNSVMLASKIRFVLYIKVVFSFFINFNADQKIFVWECCCQKRLKAPKRINQSNKYLSINSKLLNSHYFYLASIQKFIHFWKFPCWFEIFVKSLISVDVALLLQETANKQYILVMKTTHQRISK